ncbi:MAG: MFS transporter [Mucilaginibacter sp.]
MKLDKRLWVLVFICVINSLGFGIIIPQLYAYGKTFGLNGTTLGFLMSSFSIAQFFATPILGSLSDKYGRKPLLAISLVGTCISFLMFAWANCLTILFAARILDGLTGGNISVAQAIVSDTSTPADRAKKFGILSSAFGVGYIIGPAISSALANYGEQMPFFFAAIISFLGIMATIFFLEETNGDRRKKIAKEKFINFSALITTLKLPVIGTAIFISFLLTMAQFSMILGFQEFTVDVLHLSSRSLGYLYTAFAATGVVMQFCMQWLLNIIKSRSVVLYLSTFCCFIAMLLTGFTSTLIPFTVWICIYGLFNGLRNPMLNAIIADNNKNHGQGRILGVNQSYISLGQILGPIVAGFVSPCSVHDIFYLSAFFIAVAFGLTFVLKGKESAVVTA